MGSSQAHSYEAFQVRDKISIAKSGLKNLSKNLMLTIYCINKMNETLPSIQSSH